MERSIGSDLEEDLALNGVEIANALQQPSAARIIRLRVAKLTQYMSPTVGQLITRPLPALSQVLVDLVAVGYHDAAVLAEQPTTLGLGLAAGDAKPQRPIVAHAPSRPAGLFCVQCVDWPAGLVSMYQRLLQQPLS